MYKNTLKYIIIFLIVSGIIALQACKENDLFEKNSTIPNYEWTHNYAAAGSFKITDTLAFYNIYIVLRHTDAFSYNNIWLNVGLQSPGDTMYLQKVNLVLGSDAGGWEGTGMNDIWELRKLINGQPRRFKRQGVYEFKIFQIMRDNPLHDIMSAGLRLEKAN